MKPKKSLGQNFLTSSKAIYEIVNAGNIEKDELILEIGPGKGALTEKLLEKSNTVIAIEKDRELIPFLQDKYSQDIKDKRLILVEGDILELDIDDFIKKELKKNKFKKYKLIANIPYYITGAIIEKFLSIDKKPEKLVLLVQKEVAERIVARDKKESILSLAVKLYGNPKLIYKVSAGSFFPKPKVDSAVLEININDTFINKNLEKLYFIVIKKAFAFKRKMMLNNLKKELPEINSKKIDWDKIFTELKIDNKRRAEDENKDTFLKIADLIQK